MCDGVGYRIIQDSSRVNSGIEVWRKSLDRLVPEVALRRSGSGPIWKTLGTVNSFYQLKPNLTPMMGARAHICV